MRRLFVLYFMSEIREAKKTYRTIGFNEAWRSAQVEIVRHDWEKTFGRYIKKDEGTKTLIVD